MKESNKGTEQSQSEIQKGHKTLTKNSQSGLNMIDKLMLSLMIGLTLFIAAYAVLKLLGAH